MAAPFSIVLFVITFILLYTVPIVSHEESFLLEKFGAEHSRYLKKRLGERTLFSFDNRRGKFADHCQRHDLMNNLI